MLTTYGDDSYDEMQSRVCAVAGVLGRRDDWDALEKEWLDRTNGVVFHAVDCESDRGVYRNIPHRENQKLYEDLTKIIARSRVFGVGHAIDIAQHNTIFPDLLPDSVYFWCFRRVVLGCAEHTSFCVPREQVEFVFDHHVDREYNAATMYRHMTVAPEWPNREFLADKISFACRRTVGIQVADLVAREGMKELDNAVGPKSRAKRESLLALLRTGRFQFSMYGQEYFASLRRHIKKEEDDPQSPMKRALYAEWLVKKKLIDTHSNKLKYVEQLPSPKPIAAN